MSTQTCEPVSFSSLYKTAIKKNEDKANEVAHRLDARRRKLQDTILSFEPKAEKIIEDYLSGIRSSDEVTKQCVRSLANLMLNRPYSLKETVKNAKDWFEEYLANIDFFSKDNILTLLEPSPFEDSFIHVENAIVFCRKELDRFKKAVRKLITKRSLNKLAYCRDRAKSFIETVLNPQNDAYGVFDDVFKRHLSKITFIKGRHSDADNDLTLLNIKTERNTSTEPFMVFSPTKQYRKEYTEKYGKVFLPEKYDEDDISDIFYYMLKNLLSDVEISSSALSGFDWTIVIEPIE